jgi:hypothetical protein
MIRSFATRRLIVATSFVALLTLACAPVSAAPVQINFSGQIAFVEFDIGSTSFSGTTVGDPISGSVVIDDQPPGFSFCDATNSCAYLFLGSDYGGSISGGPMVMGQSALSIQNDYRFSQSETPDEDLAIANQILDPDITLDTPFDFWQAGTSTLDESSFFGLGILTLDTSQRTSADFDPVPPIAGADAIVVILEEETLDGEFSALAIVNPNAITVVPIPLPAAAWMLLGGLGVLTGFTRRRRHGSSL